MYAGVGGGETNGKHTDTQGRVYTHTQEYMYHLRGGGGGWRNEQLAYTHDTQGY